MKRIRVRTAQPYDVVIGSGLLAELKMLLPEDLRGQGEAGARAVLISDRQVDALYGENVARVLSTCGFSVLRFVVPVGEEAKSGQWYLQGLSFLAEAHVSRTDVIFALGGGVVGDLSGFLAATYLRGVRFVQLPTTLLAAVDSSVGGKTAINLPEGKNLAGAFYQPSLVVMDVETLHTLPTEIFCDGCAEVIKYGMLWDSELFATLEAQPLLECRNAGPAGQNRLIEVIARCVAIKEEIVSQDERDKGVRKLLNFGHTIGHAIEKNSGFTVSHGKAVAIGMVIATQAAQRAGMCPVGTAERLIKMLIAYGLPTTTADSDEALAAGMRADKKIEGEAIHLILPHEIGHCVIEPMPVSALQTFLRK